MSDLSFLAHPSITFKSGNLAHCINNELADRYFHVCFFVVGHMIYLCSALCTLKPKKPSMYFMCSLQVSLESNISPKNLAFLSTCNCLLCRVSLICSQLRCVNTTATVFSQPSIYIDGWLYAMSMTSVVCNVPVLSQNNSTYHHSVFTTCK